MAEPAAAPVVETPGTEPIKPAATPAPGTEPTGWMGDTGEFREGAPERITELIGKKQWTTVEQMADSYMELEAFKGSDKGIMIPDVDDENFADKMGNIYDSLGRPKTAGEYKYDGERKDMLSDELMGLFKDYAHGSGKSQAQFESDIDFQLDAIVAQEGILAQQLEEQKLANVDELKQIYGINYEAAMSDAALTSDKHGYAEKITGEGLEDSPIVKILLNHIANIEKEDGIVPNGGAPVVKTLQEQLADIKADPAFLNKFAPGRKELMARFMEVNQKIAASENAPVRMQA